MFFPYGETEIRHLSRVDPQLGGAIERIGHINRELTPDLFTALVDSIISQQISTRAAVTVGARFWALAGEQTPEVVAQLPEDEIQRCGMSLRKAGYIAGIAGAVLSGELDLAGIKNLPDNEVRGKLTALRGVGRWTADMLLIFSLARPDILSAEDFGIRKGIRLLYGIPEVTAETVAVCRERYTPYCSAASLYLWEISGANP